MRYEKNFLTKVILRLDFPTILQLQTESKPKFSSEIAERYPSVSGNSTTQVTFSVSPSGSGVDQQLKGWQWTHRNKAEGKRYVVLSSDFISLEYDKDEYKHFGPFEEDFNFIYSNFQTTYNVSMFSRIGLRYINEISLDEGNPLDWEGKISESLVTAVKAGFRNGMSLRRSMHQLNAQKDDIIILFNYGIVNPDFPNPVARRQFILDFDCHISGGIDSSELLTRIKEMNLISEEMFEQSIEDGLREHMGGSDE